MASSDVEMRMGEVRTNGSSPEEEGATGADHHNSTARQANHHDHVVDVAGAGMDRKHNDNEEDGDADAELAARASRTFDDSAPPLPLELRINNLQYFIESGTAEAKTTRQILFGIDGCVKPGELLAILGPTGAGKSSLLNLIADQVKVGEIKGSITYNGKHRTKQMKRFIAYVLQDDTFFHNLTVRETLTFSALLRLPNTLSYEDKIKVVDRVIRVLNLEKCQDTIVGNQFKRGVSGGERRRLNIGNEILTNPSLLLCDEPTSGLDSSTAHAVLQILKGLARTGRSVVCTIHQPSSRMFAEFDKLMLLADGKTIYYGPAKMAADYFNSVDHPFPQFYNPADFLLELVTAEQLQGGKAVNAELAEKYQLHKHTFLDLDEKSNPMAVSRNSRRSLNGHAAATNFVHMETPQLAANEQHEATGAVARTMSDLEKELANAVHSEHEAKKKPAVAAADASSAVVPAGSAATRPRKSSSVGNKKEADIENIARWPTTFWQQFVILLQRAYIQTRGDRFRPLWLIQYTIMAFIVGMVWFETGTTENNIQDKNGILFFTAVFWSFNGIFNALVPFPAERAVLSKERASGSYRLSAYFLAKTSSELPIEMLFPTMFIIITYWMTGLDRLAWKFFAHLFFVLLVQICCQSIGLAISTAVMDFQRAIVVASVGMLGFMLVSGFYADISNIPVWVRWVRYLAVVKYCFSGLAQIEYSGSHYTCAQNSNYDFCPSRDITGDDILAKFTLDDVSIGGNVGILLAYFVFFRLLAYFFLRKFK